MRVGWEWTDEEWGNHGSGRSPNQDPALCLEEVRKTTSATRPFWRPSGKFLKFLLADVTRSLFIFIFLQSVLGTESKCSEDVFQHKSHKYKRPFESNFNHTGPSNKMEKRASNHSEEVQKGRNVVKLPI